MILVDGSHLLHRILNTDNLELTNSTGRVVGGIHGFLKSLSKIACDRMRTEGILVAWDLGIPLHRRELHHDYKPHKKPIGVSDLKYLSEMNREGKREEDDPDRAHFREVYYQSAETLHALLPLCGCLSVRLPNVEADDIIGTWAYYVKDDKSVIFTSDKDLLQLVSENTDFHDAAHNQHMSMIDIIHDNGYNKKTWRRDFLLAKAILGDKSDNIDGVQQVGAKAAPKYASQLGEYINKGMSIEQACEQELERPYRGRQEGLDNMHISGKLIQRNFDLMDLFLPIDRDLPMTREIKSGLCANAGFEPNRPILNDLLEDLELHKAQDFCNDLYISNSTDNLKEYLHYFI